MKINKTLTSLGMGLCTFALVFAGNAAALEFNQNVTPDVIYGSGNSNGNFTVDRQNGIELGLRGKIPFTGVTHSNGDGSYSYSFAEQLAAPGSPPGKWNFDWTVNTDYQGTTGNMLDHFTYLMGIDFDPSQGTNYLVFDPITPNVAPLNAPFFDHSIGNNSTANGGGAEAGDAATYANLLANNNVLQQSWRHAFFPFHPTLTYDYSVNGTYNVFLSAFDNSGEVARTEISVIIGEGGAPVNQPVPEPSTMLLLGSGLAGLAYWRTRKSNA